MNNIKFHKQEVYKNGVTKTEYYINDKKVDERTYNTLLDDDFENHKNTYIKPKQVDEDFEGLEDKIHFITLHPQYIQALEEDYEESECENMDDFNEVKERCLGIMDIVQDLKDDIDFIKRSHEKKSAVEMLKHNAEWFLKLAAEIDKE